MTFIAKSLFLISAFFLVADAYWLMGASNILTTERLDPIVSPGGVSSHVHAVVGGSNFGTVSTASLRESQCTSIPIPQDKSNYWFPLLYFQWANGSFTSVSGGVVIYYLFSDPAGNTKAFPDNFRMISGEPTLRTYNASSFAQQAVTFLCLDFNGVSTRHNELPTKECPSGIRSQINFPSCWDGVNVDSPNHKSHVAFLSTGPDSGSCTDPNYPVTLPRVFMEVYWGSADFDSYRSQAMNPTQPFVFSNGDPLGYGYHADFVNGWDAGVLQNAVDKCNCNIYGDPTCCVQENIFGMNKGQTCTIPPTVNEQALGTLSKLPGNNPVQSGGTNAVASPATSTPSMISSGAQATNAPVPASPANVGNVQPASPSASPTSSAGIPSYQVPAPSLPTSSKPSTQPSQASGHKHNISGSHTHASYTPVVTPYHLSNDLEDCVEDPHQSTPAKPHHTSSSVASHQHSHSAGAHLASPSPVDSHKHNSHKPVSHKHSHSAGAHSASPPVHSHKHSHSSGDHSATHHGSGSNGGSASPGSLRKRTSSSQERRSTARHVARSPNAGHRFMKYRPRTF